MKLLLLIMPYFVYIVMNSQQIPDVNFNVLNPYIYNPAFCNGRFSNNVSFHYKQLWAGINESPEVQYLSATFEINKSMGVGGKMYNYNLGLIRKSGIEATYAYKFKMSDNNFVSMGLSSHLFQFYINKSKIKTEEPFDKAIDYIREKSIYPDFSFGVVYYNDRLFFGLSVLQLLNRKVTLFNDYIENRQVRHYYLKGGYDIKAAENFKVTTLLNGSFINSKIWQFDLKILFTYKEIIVGGLGYRRNDGLNFIIAYNADKMLFGYGYDYSLSDLGKQSAGSHEIVLAFKFWKNESKTLLGY
ncbi:MAG: PorP/SprF family type IX secretion system membrane protein [Bacteroidales bacterium]|nr:PorP/SprF family type IX secretion system membrane protein [Bacteroidales bacterium]